MLDSWVMFGVAALLLRAGFALYAAGISRSKNTISCLFRATVEIAAGVLAFWLLGSAIHGSWREIAHPMGSTAMFLAAIFLIGPAVVSGATLERGKAIVGIVAAILLPGFLIPFGWKLLQWNWLISRGFVDEAGAIFIHVSAGLFAIVAAIAIGPRLGKYNRDGSTNVILGHNLPLASGGILLIFSMWPAYVGALAGADSASAGFNALLAAAGAVVAAAVYCVVRYGRSDVFLVFAGLLGGLVAITAGADLLTPSEAVAIGAVAGIIVPYAVVRLDMFWKIDDPAGGIAIHLVGGIWSAVAIAALAPGNWEMRLRRLGVEGIGLGIIVAFSLVVSCLVFFILRATTGLRVSEADEFEGMDLAKYDLNAYPDFQQTTIKSYHLREM
jgi:ammonium transporter, Amt family